MTMLAHLSTKLDALDERLTALEARIEHRLEASNR